MHKRKGGKQNNKEKKQKITADVEQHPNTGFPFFENMFANFLTELIALLEDPTNMMLTCHSMYDLRRNNNVAFRKLKYYAKYNTRDAPGYFTSQYFCGTITGYLLQNYPSFITRHERQKWKDPNYKKRGNNNGGLEDVKSKDFEKMLQDIHIYSKMNNVMFTIGACRRMLMFSQCAIFQTYARLLSYNIFVVFPIITNIYSCLHLFQPRILHLHERALFNEVPNPLQRPPRENPIHTYEEFKNNMATYFRMDIWETFLSWDEFVLVGGAVVKSILVDSFESKSTQDIDLFWIAKNNTRRRWSKNDGTYYDYEKAVKFFARKLGGALGPDNVSVSKRFDYVRTVTATFPATGHIPEKVIPFQFIWYSDRMTPASVIQIFDLECCQVGYAGGEVFCSYAFSQSIATRTTVNYKLVNDSNDLETFMPRTQKYIARGFTLLTPKNFDVTLLDKPYEVSTLVPARTDDKYGFLLNNDSLLVRSQFITLIDPTAPHPHEPTNVPPPPYLSKKSMQSEKSDESDESESEESDEGGESDESDESEDEDDLSDFQCIVGGAGPYFVPHAYWPKSK